MVKSFTQHIIGVTFWFWEFIQLNKSIESSCYVQSTVQEIRKIGRMNSISYFLEEKKL